MNSAGVLELSAQGADTGKQKIPAGSALVLLNDQDTVGMCLISGPAIHCSLEEVYGCQKKSHNSVPFIS